MGVRLLLTEICVPFQLLLDCITTDIASTYGLVTTFANPRSVGIPNSDTIRLYKLLGRNSTRIYFQLG